MRTTARDDLERGPRGPRGPRGHGHGRCGGGSGCCGGIDHGGSQHRGREEETADIRRVLEERQRDLEEALAEVTGELRDLDASRP